MSEVTTYWHIGVPLNLDATIVFLIRHTKTGDDVRSEYGGLDGKWREFKEYEVLDLNFEGGLLIPGREWMVCRGETWDQYMKWMDSCVQGT